MVSDKERRVWFLEGRLTVDFLSGPFEFTKLSSQIELLMARSRMASVDDPSHIKKYQPGGTFQSASRIVGARGFAGLYSGFHLHFSRFKLGKSVSGDED